MHKLQPSTNQLVSVARVYPKPLATEYGSLMGFAWVGFLATVRINGYAKGGPLHISSIISNTNQHYIKHGRQNHKP